MLDLLVRLVAILIGVGATISAIAYVVQDTVTTWRAIRPTPRPPRPPRLPEEAQREAEWQAFVTRHEQFMEDLLAGHQPAPTFEEAMREASARAHYDPLAAKVTRAARELGLHKSAIQRLVDDEAMTRVLTGQAERLAQEATTAAPRPNLEDPPTDYSWIEMEDVYGRAPRRVRRGPTKVVRG